MAVIDTDDSQRAILADDAVPLAWYERQTYEEIKAQMADGDAFVPTYEEWELHAKQVEAFFLAKGVPTVRVHVDPREFAAWCAVHHQALNVKGRLAYSEWAARWRPHNRPRSA